jgi:UrcA family protein
MALCERLVEHDLNGGGTGCRTGYQSTPSQGVHVMKKFTLVTTALVLVGSIFTVAEASPPSDAPTTVVKFGDLDTTHAAGQEQLYRRVTRAAQVVCRPLDPGTSGAQLSLISLHAACVDKAIANAVAQINRSEFTDYVASRMPNPVSPAMRLASR